MDQADEWRCFVSTKRKEDMQAPAAAKEQGAERAGAARNKKSRRVELVLAIQNWSDICSFSDSSSRGLGRAVNAEVATCRSANPAGRTQKRSDSIRMCCVHFVKLQSLPECSSIA